MYKRILVAIDGSATAERGFDEALALAKRLGSSLVLLDVVEVYPMMMEMATATTWEAVSTGLQDAAQEVLDRARAKAVEDGVACEAHRIDSGAARVCDAIVEAAREHRCDLIVMGTHGRRGVQHALLGSDAERVLRLASVPVLLVRAPEGA